MNLQYRLESAGRTRFLLALSLSTLTALGVAAPLAMQAMRADEATFASGDAATAPAESNPEDVTAEIALDRSISDSGSGQKGGIQASEDTSKATGRTTKAESAESIEPTPTEEPAPEGVLTNAEPESVETDPVVTPEPEPDPTPTPPSGPSTTVPTSEVPTSVSSTDTTEDSSTSSTETTVEDTTTSSTDTTTTTTTTESSTTSSSETAVPVPLG